MDLRRARTFVTIADLGTVTKAAIHLRVAQPALSRQVSDLEREFGFRLFDRLGRRLVLTGEGQRMLEACRALLDRAEAVAEQALVLRRGDAGSLKVAASPQFIESVAASFLPIYSERFPAVDVTLTEAIGWPDVRGLLERGEVHIAQTLLRAVAGESCHFHSQPLPSVDLLAAHHPTFDLGSGAALDISGLKPWPLLLLDRSFVFRRTFDAACLVAGFSPQIAFESRTPHTLLAMALNKHGLAIIPSALSTQGYHLRITGLTYKGDALREPLAVVWSTRRSLPHYTHTFCEMLAAYSDTRLPAATPSNDVSADSKG